MGEIINDPAIESFFIDFTENLLITNNQKEYFPDELRKIKELSIEDRNKNEKKIEKLSQTMKKHKQDLIEKGQLFGSANFSYISYKKDKKQQQSIVNSLNYFIPKEFIFRTVESEFVIYYLFRLFKPVIKKMRNTKEGNRVFSLEYVTELKRHVENNNVLKGFYKEQKVETIAIEYNFYTLLLDGVKSLFEYTSGYSNDYRPEVKITDFYPESIDTEKSIGNIEELLLLNRFVENYNTAIQQIVQMKNSLKYHLNLVGEDEKSFSKVAKEAGFFEKIPFNLQDFIVVVEDLIRIFDIRLINNFEINDVTGEYEKMYRSYKKTYPQGTLEEYYSSNGSINLQSLEIADKCRILHFEKEGFYRLKGFKVIEELKEINKLINN